MENVSCKRCRAPSKLDGLNVVDFQAKCVSLHLSCFASLRDDFGASKWHYLARYFIGSRLAHFDNRFSFRSNLCPVSARPSNFYHKTLEQFEKLFAKEGKLPDDLSCKHL